MWWLVTTIVWAILALLSAAGSWYGLERGPRVVLRIARPLTVVALLGVALCLQAWDTVGGRAILLALALSLSAELVATELGSRWFIAALGCTVAAYLAYTAAFATWFSSLPWAVMGLALAAVFAATAGRRIFTAARARAGAAVGWVVLAVAVTSALCSGAAGGTAYLLVLLGALLLGLSHTIAGLMRFIGPRARGELVSMALAQLAHALIITGSLPA